MCFDALLCKDTYCISGILLRCSGLLVAVAWTIVGNSVGNDKYVSPSSRALLRVEGVFWVFPSSGATSDVLIF